MILIRKGNVLHSLNNLELPNLTANKARLRNRGGERSLSSGVIGITFDKYKMA